MVPGQHRRGKLRNTIGMARRQAVLSIPRPHTGHAVQVEMVTVISPDFETSRDWDQMTDWLLETFGRPSRRWNYYADADVMNIYFTDEFDAMLYILRWGGRIQ